MQPIRPYITIPQDNSDRIMSRSGEIIGFSKTRVVWKFGFLPYSDNAHAFGLSTDYGFYWVISTVSGKVLDTFKGYALELPERFIKIISCNYENDIESK